MVERFGANAGSELDGNTADDLDESACTTVDALPSGAAPSGSAGRGKFQITRLAKRGGPLTKRITLSDNKVNSDGSACIMWEGTAQRAALGGVGDLAVLIQQLGPHQAIALGSLRSDLPDSVTVTTKQRLHARSGAAATDVIARTTEFIGYEPGQPAFALLDFDTKGMPPDVDGRIAALGGFWGAMVSVLPDLASVARVERRSTSAGLVRTDTGEHLPGSDGVHVYLPVTDGQDIGRFLKTLHERCWLAGFGWLMVGAGGQVLERSIIDRSVAAPERLVFEGAPILEPPLAQDAASRRPVATDGETLDTRAACGSLTLSEQARLDDMRVKAARQLESARLKARDEFIARQAEKLVRHTGLTPQQAARVVARQCEGVLLPDVVLPFDDPDLAGITVGDVLADPARFEGATLSDPLEGPEYGTCKARIMRQADGRPWIHSFAHGRTIYRLCHDARSIKAALARAKPDEAADTFIASALAGDLTADETDSLVALAANRAGIGKRPLAASLKLARQERDRREADAERDRRRAERCDPRPQLSAPAADAEWLPQMQAIDDVLSSSPAPEPPMRDVEGFLTEVRDRSTPGMHLLTASAANAEAKDKTFAPAPEQPTLTRLSDLEVAELIERHIEYVEPDGRPVHLHSSFVGHYVQRSDSALPTVRAVATLPLVLPDGTVLNGAGLDRDRGIVFRIPQYLLDLLLKPGTCPRQTVVEAMRFLTDEWLVDVATDYAGKCILIAAALTVVERLLLSERPAFFITAGQRGGGKTITLNMVSTPVLGSAAAAAAWSSSEEERRKALFSYLDQGVPLIAWDNIPRGAAISCPSIEKALTAEKYMDRVLGETGIRTVPAYAVQFFTGNNISPRGDMASRSLSVRLAVERPDPENREFIHAHPLAWTRTNRLRILHALYMILLGNPRLHDPDPAPAETRFKGWWHLVGSAVEHAAQRHTEYVDGLAIDAHPRCRPTPIRFRDLFLAGEADDEQTSSLAIVLEMLRGRWPGPFTARQVADFITGGGEAACFLGRDIEAAAELKAALEQATGKPLPVINSTTVSWRLKALKDAPVQIDGCDMVLHYSPDRGATGGTFAVRATR